MTNLEAPAGMEAMAAKLAKPYVFIPIVIGLIIFVNLVGAGGMTLMIIVFSAVLVGLYYGYQQAKVRREMLQRYATENGWEFSPRDDRWIETFHRGPLSLGRDQKALHVVTGVHKGHNFVVFDFEYTTGSGKNSRTVQYALTMLDVNGWIPDLELVPENWNNKIGSGDNLDTESIEFNKKWVVRATDPRIAHAILNPNMITFLLENGAVYPLGWWIEKNVIAVYDINPIQPANIVPTLDRLDQLLGFIPAWVLEDSRQ